jgi:hypothetical protein
MMDCFGLAEEVFCSCECSAPVLTPCVFASCFSPVLSAITRAIASEAAALEAAALEVAALEVAALEVEVWK